MNTLYVLYETYTNGFRGEILNFISLITIVSGICVIISKNPIVSVLFLISLFLSIASYLITIGISFIGLSYLLVYVGAVSILFLFILMLINVRISELISDSSNSIPLAVLIAIFFSYPVNQILPYSLTAFHDYNFIIYNNSSIYNYFSDYIKISLNFSNYSDEIAYVTGNIWDANLAETTHIISIGNIMYTSYSIWLIITSIILLLAMVGAIVITIKQKD